MIILSGVLVVLAIGLLIAGILAGASGVAGIEGLQLIYISIGVSIVSALCLLIGVIIRRKEIFGSAGAVSARAKGPKPVKPGKVARQAKAAVEPLEEEAFSIASQPLEVPLDSPVFVVRGRKRYHLESCRQLAGRDKEDLTYEEALEEGFSPCTACLPDTALAARAAMSAGEPAAADDLSEGQSPVIAGGLSRSAAASQPGAFGTRTPEWDLPPVQSGFEAPVAFAPEEQDPVGGVPAPAAPWEVPSWGRSPLTDPIPEAAPVEEPATAELSAVPGSFDQELSWEVVPPRHSEPEPEHEPAIVDFRSAETETETETETGTEVEIVPVAEVEAEVETEVEAEGDPLGAEAWPEPVETPAPEPEPAHAETAEFEPERAVDETVPAAAAQVPTETGAPRVRILSGTKRYHRPDCALIEDIGEEAEDLETLSRDEAKERGCTPCLVCQPDKEPSLG
ncbi:MAG: hypothetical protein JWN00_288 [Actinomycetia bacterium]|nr:hypothetical protein [Actinomycetes bacterium]